MSFHPKRRLKTAVKARKSIDEGPNISQLPVLRRKRTLIVNRLNKIFSTAEEISDDPDTFFAQFSVVDKLYEDFNIVHTDIISLVDSELVSMEEEIQERFDKTYYSLIRIHNKFKRLDNEMSRSSSVEHSKSKNIKLPKITIPKFSGFIKEWPEFYDIFGSLVDRNESLSDTERMHYLMNSLSGDAHALIRTYPVQGTYYRQAFETLVSRYKNDRELAFSCWREILNISFNNKTPIELRRTLDLFCENLKILKDLNLPVDSWGFILCYHTLSKLPHTIRCNFEETYTSNELPNFDNLLKFIYAKCDALVRDTHFTCQEQIKPSQIIPKHSHQFQNVKKPVKSPTVFLANEPKSKKSFDIHSNSHTTPSTSFKNAHTHALNQSRALPTTQTPLSLIVKCSYCSDNHSVNQCKRFAQITVAERMDYAKTNRWCFNCLKPSHTLKYCKSIFRCQKCRLRHHTLLHEEAKPDLTTNEEPCTSQLPNQLSVLTSLGDQSIVLLSTAIIQIRDATGSYQSCRALIDSGSQAHFITEQAAERLKLKYFNSSHHVRGLGNTTSTVSGTVQLDIGTNNRNLFTVNAYTLPVICGKMPSTAIDISSWSHISSLQLADPDCHKPSPIDVLLGAEVFASLLLPGNITGTQTQPSAINSVFGWLLTGNSKCASTDVTSLFINTDDSLLQEVKRFWELESFENLSSTLTPEEKRCEELYTTSCSRDSNGRYIVALPFKNEERPIFFPGSRDTALRCFHSLERRLAKIPNLKKQYGDFMTDYLESGHMSLVPAKELGLGRYYIPHHCVHRPDSSTTKLRVVFNASSKDVIGVSLNDTLLIGPKLQTNIKEILLKFRFHSVVFTCDMRQMYRMIALLDTDRDYQRIFWRFDSNQPIQEYRLNTVTYGISSAPFLACRTVKQLVIDEGKAFPLASEVLSSHLYVDDIVSGFKSLEKAVEAKSEIIELLKKGNFELRKWASNVPELLADLPPEHCLTSTVTLDVDDNHTLKVLGLRWNPHNDCFFFTVNPQQRKCTKRNILSEIARIFDPLGFLAPITIVAKVLVQRLWVLNIGWDADPPEDITQFWNNYLSQFPSLTKLHIPRCLSVTNLKSCELHGFSDSSEKAYGAVVYLRVVDREDKVKVFFICSKGRVAPIKSTSLPRLELCGAVILADLLKFVQQAYLPVIQSFDAIYAWSDSTIVLAWLRSHPSKWKTFVANRISKIVRSIPEAHWNHVNSEDNPADVIARGQLPSAIIDNSLWWAGPHWLTKDRECWPISTKTTTQDEEIINFETRKLVLTCVDNIQSETHLFESLLNKYSSLHRLVNVIAYINRFIHYTRFPNNSNKTNFVSNVERHNALLQIVKFVQSQAFYNELANLKQGKVLTKSFQKLNPFIDSNGVLRVGGRIKRSGLEYEQKHPALLPSHHSLTMLIIDHIHRNYLHPGVNTTQFLLLQHFWIISAKRSIRNRISKCIRCFRANPKPLQPFMSDLPSFRVNQVKPFSISGVDYAGPFRIRLGARRSTKIDKAYLGLFICLATKAVHLEVVSSLSTEAFVAALRRFVARRGRCSVIHADCGTNFVGAKNLFTTIMTEASHTENIQFKFNVPSGAHFGGVWESQIKVAKSLLFRVVGDQILNFEELTTLFTQIEAILNSRPLCPISSDPNDLSALTPGHFLTLEPLQTVPDEDLSSINVNRLQRWQLIQSIQQNFWSRWKHEYLNSLTQRAKWTRDSRPLKVGDMVIIKDENRAPLHWLLARVVELLPGKDGVCRVAVVKTANNSNILKRPLVKLCPLPNNE